MPPRKDPIDRFLPKVQHLDNGCWQWTAALSTEGYARFTDLTSDGRYTCVYGHRWAYTHFVGPIPDGLELDHLCRNRGCVNPEHLEPVTRSVNLRRGEHLSGRTARTGLCQRGHSMADAIIQPNGGRRCRTCCNALRRARYQARRAES